MLWPLSRRAIVKYLLILFDLRGAVLGLNYRIVPLRDHPITITITLAPVSLGWSLSGQWTLLQIVTFNTSAHFP